MRHVLIWTTGINVDNFWNFKDAGGAGGAAMGGAAKLAKDEAAKLAKPKVIANELNIFFDVDDTLVMWGEAFSFVDYISVQCPYDGEYISLRPHQPHIKLLKNYHERGAHVTVWSQGGYQWAEAVVKALGLGEFVDVIMTKPRAYVDDLPASEWMGERIYISPESAWGVTTENK